MPESIKNRTSFYKVKKPKIKTKNKQFMICKVYSFTNFSEIITNVNNFAKTNGLQCLYTHP